MSHLGGVDVTDFWEMPPRFRASDVAGLAARVGRRRTLLPRRLSAEERIFIELMTSGRKLEAPREGSK